MIAKHLTIQFVIIITALRDLISLIIRHTHPLVIEWHNRPTIQGAKFLPPNMIALSLNLLVYLQTHFQLGNFGVFLIYIYLCPDWNWGSHQGHKLIRWQIIPILKCWFPYHVHDCTLQRQKKKRKKKRLGWVVGVLGAKEFWF